MSQKKHIDRLFQEKFKDFEVTPDPNIWNNIETKLNENKTKNPKIGIPIWAKLGAVAAIILILITSGTFLFNSNYFNSDLDTTITETQVSDADKIVTSSTKSNPSNTIKNSKNNPNELENNQGFKTDSEQLEKVAIEDVSAEKNATQTVKNNINTSSNTKPNASNFVTNTSKKESNSKDNVASVSNKKASLTNNPNPNRNYLTKKEANINTNYSNKNYSSSKINSSKQVLTGVNSTKQYSNTSNSNLKNKASNKNNLTQINSNSQASLSNYKYTNTSNLQNKASDLNAFIKPIVKIPADSVATYAIIIRDAKSIEAAIEESERLFEKEKLGNRWSISPNIAPVYYNSFGKGSQFGDQFVNNGKTGETNTSYGISVGYVINEKLKVRTGVNKLNLSYDTDDVIVFESVSNSKPKSFLNIDLNNNSNNQNISVISADNLAIQQVNSALNFNAALSQRINYIEVPLELEYVISDNKFGVNIIGGISTFLLEDNLVVSEFDGYKTDIGKANNINNLSFTTNIGLGLNYKFSKSFIYIFEPTFKYQVNGFSNTSGSFNPYIIGVYTGFSYKF